MDNTPVNLAVLFADVSGSTRLYEKLGDARALECIGLCLNIMREVTAEHRGRVVKAIGDELMCVFPIASAAAQAAADMQSRVSMQDPVDGQRLAIRVGLHFGPVLEQANDVFGDSVNVAARMTSLANAGRSSRPESVDALPPSLKSVPEASIRSRSEANRRTSPFSRSSGSRAKPDDAQPTVFRRLPSMSRLAARPDARSSWGRAQAVRRVVMPHAIW
jgi:hypothetical protein